MILKPKLKVANPNEKDMIEMNSGMPMKNSKRNISCPRNKIPKQIGIATNIEIGKTATLSR